MIDEVEGRREPLGRLTDAAFLFPDAGQNPRTLEPGEILDENFPLQVIHFVLNANRKQAVRFEVERLAISVQCTHSDPVRAFDFVVDAGDRQAALLELRRTTPFEDLRIDENF